jgi:hypothetical protein
MITVDVADHAKVYATGCKLLNDGTGDWTKEKYGRPPWTDADHKAYMAKAKAETEARRG